jgi:hypothetical protein
MVNTGTGDQRYHRKHVGISAKWALCRERSEWVPSRADRISWRCARIARMAIAVARALPLANLSCLGACACRFRPRDCWVVSPPTNRAPSALDGSRFYRATDLGCEKSRVHGVRTRKQRRQA